MAEQTKMQTFRVTDPESGKTVKLTGESAPTEQELEEVFASLQTQETTKPTVREIMSGKLGEGKVAQVAENIISDTIMSPLTAFARGFAQSGSAAYDKVRAVTELADTAIGTIQDTIPQQAQQAIPMMREMGMARPALQQALQQAGQVAGQFSEQMAGMGEQLPETGMGKGIDTVYEILGGVIPTVTSFAAAKTGLAQTGVSGVLKNLGLDQLNPVAQFSVLNAVQEYSKNPTTEALAKGASDGAIIGMSFPIASKGLQILKNAGRNV